MIARNGKRERWGVAPGAVLIAAGTMLAAFSLCACQQSTAVPPRAQPVGYVSSYPFAPGAPPPQGTYAAPAPIWPEPKPQYPLDTHPQYPPSVRQQYPPAPTPQSSPPLQPSSPVAQSSDRPLLGPLIGPLMWQTEAQAVRKELITNLSAQNQALVATIPLVIDTSTNEVNAFAGCDDSGAPFVAGTEGLLEAIDGMSQTRATDELYGTHTYDAYTNAVAAGLVSQKGASALLPAGIIPPASWIDPRRVSRAHEIFDEIVAFTFGHELSHHYLGHTGCAHGQPQGVPPKMADLGRLLSSAVPLFNQPNEIAADASGCFNVLDTGAARAPYAYRWTEAGGLLLLDFFARLERASGASPLLDFLRTHPNPGLRIPVLQGVAATWHYQHPA